MALGRAFSVLWGANAASNLADGLAFVSIPLLASSLTEDPRWVAGLATIYAVVRLAVALPIGVWVDRANRRTLLAVANIARGGILLGLAVCVQVGVGGLAVLYVAYAMVGALESAADNAALAIVPDIVCDPDLDRAKGGSRRPSSLRTSSSVRHWAVSCSPWGRQCRCSPWVACGLSPVVSRWLFPFAEAVPGPGRS
jgi:MFS family permease